MKKLLIAAAMLIASTGIFAQTKAKTHVAKADSAKKTAKMAPAAKTTTTTTTTKTTTATPTKKDGTADMRFKANKEAAKPAGPTKKDGTADMRYKANKKDTTRKKN